MSEQAMEIYSPPFTMAWNEVEYSEIYDILLDDIAQNLLLSSQVIIAIYQVDTDDIAQSLVLSSEQVGVYKGVVIGNVSQSSVLSSAQIGVYKGVDIEDIAQSLILSSPQIGAYKGVEIDDIVQSLYLSSAEIVVYKGINIQNISVKQFLDELFYRKVGKPVMIEFSDGYYVLVIKAEGRSHIEEEVDMEDFIGIIMTKIDPISIDLTGRE